MAEFRIHEPAPIGETATEEGAKLVGTVRLPGGGRGALNGLILLQHGMTTKGKRDASRIAVR
jgi:hypothetical protein